MRLMEHSLAYIQKLREQGGPQLEHYEELEVWLSDIYNRVNNGDLGNTDVALLREAFGEAFSLETMQGFAFLKPHGYAGDYEIIDRIYQTHVSPVPHLSNWDKYWQSTAAAEAVRNRKSYMHTVITDCLITMAQRPLRILNVASGPGRDMYEYFQLTDSKDVQFICLEQDPKAIAFASSLCHEFMDRITFIPANVLRYKPEGQYQLVWSAGLFDYFDDKIFKRLLTRFLSVVDSGGQLVIGNFSDQNSTRPYMELCDWSLHHRSPKQLTSLAQECDIPSHRIHLGIEPAAVNLFLHIRCT